MTDKTRKPLTEEHKRNISIAKMGVKLGPHSDERKAKISEALRGNSNRSGKPQSEEAKMLISEKNSGKKFSEEHKRKLSEAKLGKPKSEEHRLKMAESQRRRREKENEEKQNDN